MKIHKTWCKMYLFALMLCLSTVFSSCSNDDSDDGSEKGSHEWVDLGLSVKWATCNIGAKKTNEIGNYYAWGETETKNRFEDVTYKHCTGNINGGLIKYCDDNYRGDVDDKFTLDPEDDVAHVKWGGNWRMPSKSEQTELINKCDWTWTKLNGVNGFEVKSKINGNTIFLPAGGYIDDEENGKEFDGEYIAYWSSSLHTGGCDYAWSIECWNDRNIRPNEYGWRSVGYNVRAVCP